MSHYWFLSDDCYISFRYARNLVEGHGLVYNPGERVEGFSNPLWVLLLACGHLLTAVDTPTLARLLGLSCRLTIERGDLLRQVTGLISQVQEENTEGQRITAEVTVVPALGLLTVHEPDVRFVDKSRRLKSLPRLLMG